MNILLDIDGVMVPAKSWSQPELLEDGFPSFSVKATYALNKLIAATQASVVLTTSHKERYSVTQWKAIFKKRGIVVPKLSKLPDNKSFLDRYQEVMQWIKSQNNEIEYIIIDDDKGLNKLEPQVKERFILTSGTVGLTEFQVDSILTKIQPDLNKSA